MRIITVLAVLALTLSTAVMADTGSIASGGPGPERVLKVADVSGPDPLSEMTRYTGRSFDWQYMMSMYKQDSMIACIASLGTYRASCQALKNLSLTIYQEQLALNNGLEWASLEFTNAPKPNPDARRMDSVFRGLSKCTGTEFDRQYASVMIELMKQSGRAAQRAILEVEDGHLQAQAHATYRVNSGESKSLERYR